MGIIAWIVLGLGAGLLANLLIPGRRSEGLFLTCLIGIAGALLVPSSLAINCEYIMVTGMDAGRKLRQECEEKTKTCLARYDTSWNVEDL